MIILDKKSYDLLFYLLKLEEPETVMAISKKLNQSRRKIYYHLDKINQALPEGVPEIVSYPLVGVRLTAAQKAACALLLEGLDDYSYVLNVAERGQLMLIAIAVGGRERVTIERLMALTGVSRNTVINDLNLLREQLAVENDGIKLQVTKARGYYLDSPFLSKVRLLYRLTYDVYTQGSESFMGLVQAKLLDGQLESPLTQPEVRGYFQEQLVKVKANLGKTLNSQEGELMLHLLPYLLSSYRHTSLTEEERTNLLADFQQVRQRKEYRIAQEMAAGLGEDLQLVLDDIEICLIATLLLSYRKDSDSHLESQDYQQMREDIDAFLACFENRYQLNFRQRSDLERQLLTHCKSLIYRKTYGILSINPLTKHIRSKYPELFYMTKACSSLLEEAWQLSLRDEDIAYLTIHLGGSLRSQQQERERVVLVCDEGIGVQKLFLSQCRRYLKSSLIEAVFTSEQFASVADLLEGKLAITTVALDQSPIPSLQVNPILTHDDIVRILRFVGRAGQGQTGDLGDQLERYLRQYLKDEQDIYALRSQIEKLVHQELLSVVMVESDEPR